jgi:hypothetical protein
MWANFTSLLRFYFVLHRAENVHSCATPPLIFAIRPQQQYRVQSATWATIIYVSNSNINTVNFNIASTSSTLICLITTGAGTMQRNVACRGGKHVRRIRTHYHFRGVRYSHCPYIVNSCILTWKTLKMGVFETSFSTFYTKHTHTTFLLYLSSKSFTIDHVPL